MKKCNIIVSIFTILIGSIAIYLASSFPSGQGNVVGPGFFPIAVSCLLILLGLLLLVQTLRNKMEDKEVSFFNKENKLAYLVMLITLIYLVLMNFVGFLISSIIYLAIVMVIYGMNSKIKAVFYSVLVSGVVYFVFANLLSVPLP